MIHLIRDNRVLQFGRFTLKSGVQSPFFFDFGRICSGQSLQALGRLYAETIVAQAWTFDLLVGPAYKGIPIVTATAMSLASLFDISVPIAYNRKEAKVHGEGGQWVGELKGKRIVLLDDVLTAGTALSQAVADIRSQGGQLVGVVVALDRQAPHSADKTASEALSEAWQVPVLSLITLMHIIEHYQMAGDVSAVKALKVAL